MNTLNFTKQFSLAKTISMGAIPVGATLEQLTNKGIIDSGVKLSNDVSKVKNIIARFNKAYASKLIEKIVVSDSELDDLYQKFLHQSDNKKDYVDACKQHCKSFSEIFHKDKEFKDSTTVSKIIKNGMPDYCENEDERELVKEFKNNTGYFLQYQSNLDNAYSGEYKETEIAYRAVQNIDLFMQNYTVWNDVISKELSAEELNKINSGIGNYLGISLDDVFSSIHNVNNFMSQTAIDNYNTLLGGLGEAGLEGINVIINLHNQREKTKVPKLQMLYKQIFMDSVSKCVIPVAIKSNKELIDMIDLFISSNFGASSSSEKLHSQISGISNFDSHSVFVDSKNITSISHRLYKNFNILQIGRDISYEITNPKPAKMRDEKYEKEKQKAFNSADCYSIDDLCGFVDTYNFNNSDNQVESLTEKIVSTESDLYYNMISAVMAYKNANKSEWMSSGYKISKNESASQIIRNVLSEIKEYQKFISYFSVTETADEKDDAFYATFDANYSDFAEIDRVYNLSRNYLTKKLSQDGKTQLFFGIETLGNGISKNNEETHSCIYLTDNDGNYYVGILDSMHRRLIGKDETLPEPTDKYYTKHEFDQIADFNKMLAKVFFSMSWSNSNGIPPQIQKIRDNKSYQNNRDDEIALIGYYIDCIQKYSAWDVYNFRFKSANEYESMAEFVNYLNSHRFVHTEVKLSAEFVENKINNGELYLFKLYNKDFSEKAHGNDNLFTTYIKSLYSKENFDSQTIKLNGGLTFWYKPAVIPKNSTTIHPANEPLNNKRPINGKLYRSFKFDIIKDRRFTEDSFEIHFPITFNFMQDKANTKDLNQKVLDAIRENGIPYVIGVDRGSRNLVTISVVDPANNKIVEQKSLNVIDNGVQSVDYHAILNQRVTERNDARQNWSEIQNVKDIKKSFCGDVVHEIACLLKKYEYNAVVVLENLNSGFKNQQASLENNVYQNFENQLAQKLAYLVYKDVEASDVGGCLNALQLATPIDKYNTNMLQNGIIFYVNAWNTSKIDPTTGFINAFYAKYTNVSKAQQFFSTFDDISYVRSENMYKFSARYSQFKNSLKAGKDDWEIYTNGERLKNTGAKINLTEKMTNLFENYGIDVNANLKEQIVARTEKDFFCDLINLFNYTVQLRNVDSKVGLDYIKSPVKNSDGNFFDSRLVTDDTLPRDGDTNGAYNIARKGILLLENYLRKDASDAKIKNVSNEDWLNYTQLRN